MTTPAEVDEAETIIYLLNRAGFTVLAIDLENRRATITWPEARETHA